jgi:hypothetical protein
MYPHDTFSPNSSRVSCTSICLAAPTQIRVQRIQNMFRILAITSTDFRGYTVEIRRNTVKAIQAASFTVRHEIRTIFIKFTAKTFITIFPRTCGTVKVYLLLKYCDGQERAKWSALIMGQGLTGNLLGRCVMLLRFTHAARPHPLTGAARRTHLC